MAKNKHIVIGQLGEKLAEQYLKNRGLRLIERNFRKKWGEIDLILKKDNVLHFVEVKAGERKAPFPKEGSDVHRPEDHMTEHKKARLRRVIETYLHEKNIAIESEWTVDVAIVLMDTEVKKAKVDILRNVTLD